MTMSHSVYIADEQAMLTFGAELAASCADTAIIFLYGNLGAGKTTLTRGFLHGLGYEGKVKSPTYTIVEPYEIKNMKIYHFDFYRIHDPEELEFIGLDDYFMPFAICIVEWPQHGKQLLPASDLSCYIEPHAAGRQLRLEAHSAIGKQILKNIIQN